MRQSQSSAPLPLHGVLLIVRIAGLAGRRTFRFLRSSAASKSGLHRCADLSKAKKHRAGPHKTRTSACCHSGEALTNDRAEIPS